jgi:riboflavin kinase / FMN adenylyltransferase
MDVFSTLENLPAGARGAVVAIGNFDGVHRGHQALLARAQAIARAQGVKFAVLTFDPHPRSLFQPDAPPFCITPPALKAQRLEGFGVDLLFTLRFDWDFAGQSAQDFIQDILKTALAAEHVVVGYDFKFGQFRKGAPEDIQADGIPVTVVDEVADEDEGEVSSSRVRQYIRHGQVESANAVLGWDWEMRGLVVKGDQRGRELGFPTANFAMEDIVHPAYGVYAARVQIEGEDLWRPAAVNIGIRPMFELKTAQVESYILDFSGDLYGRLLRVRPVRHLRSEAKFATLEDLITQMNKDCEAAREILKL